MPFGCESYVDDWSHIGTAGHVCESPMPFGCESYVDMPNAIHIAGKATLVTNAFRL